MDHLDPVQLKKKKDQTKPPTLNSIYIQLHIALHAIFGARTCISLSSSGRGVLD